MDDIQIPMHLPLDEGFLRRECPHCEREFKVRVEQHTPLFVAEQRGESTQRFCPLCHEPASINAWWTKRQLEYRSQLAHAAISDEAHGLLGRTFGRLNQPGGLIQMDIQRGEVQEPISLDEPCDMTRVNPPCHQETSLKIPDDWSADVACFECGVRYPVDVLRPGA